MGSSLLETDSSTRRAPISPIVDLTREMLAAARRGDWDAVSRSEVTRRGLINQAFGGDADPVRVAGLADFLEEILRLDRELIAHAEAARRQCAAQLGALRKSKKALKAYQSPAVTP